jgi:hypothetical protein
MSREVGRLVALDLGRPVDYPSLVNDSEVSMPAGGTMGQRRQTGAANSEQGQRSASRGSKQRTAAGTVIRVSGSDQGPVEVPRYGGQLFAFVVVGPVGAVGNGVGAPFSTTPQAGGGS